MHHPQPQHSPSTQRHIHTDLIDGYLSPHVTAPSSRQFSSEEFHQPQENVEQQQYAMSVHPPVPPPLGARTPEAYHGFQVSAARLPMGSPTFALRPVTAPFGHIEYPNVSPAQSQISDGYDSEQQESIAAAYNHLHSREHSYSDRQPAYEGTGLGFGYSEPQKLQNVLTQCYQTSSERSQQERHFDNEAAQQMERLSTVRPPVRRRARGDSNSSVASMWSSVAVAGEPTYRNEVLLDDANMSGPYGTHNSPIPSNDQFQPHSALATYSYNNILVANGHQYTGTMQDSFPSSPVTGMDIDPPIMVPPAPRPDELELQDPDHPFTYQGAHWDVSNGAFSVASTDGDAASLHSQDQPSSRDSSEPARGSRRGRKAATTDSSETPEQKRASGEGRKKTVMACHFCRFRKLRCDGGHPCSHCVHREKECTYDATIRRRGPGRRNKSAQETARVQLANRQREEAAREATVQKESKPQTEGRTTRSKEAKEETHRDAWSQTSPRTNQFPASFWNDNTAFYPPDARSQLQFPTLDDSPTGRQEYQALSIPFGHARQQGADVPRLPREVTQTPFMRQYQSEGHRRSASGPLAPGLQTPVSQGSSSYYEGSPGRTSSQQQQYPPSVAGYASNRYSVATSQGGDSGHSHTDSESTYAYSEGANVLPYGYQQPQREPRQQPDMQAPFKPAAGALQYLGEANRDVRMMNTYNDGRARVDGYGVRR
ncbi:unnamed protein product [Rhizoctonia solani]|uniref:Zn(2)-C6 fungal-type domain-containing protein n=1 Tax=Rhizoctonia solani TaxID=456999 RepID=A0A8H3DAS7_9AGAM|nr:unnamed protein product [Rhizoctonia solani]